MGPSWIRGPSPDRWEIGWRSPVCAQHCRAGRSPRTSGDFQRTKRLLAVSIACGGGGPALPSCSSQGEESGGSREFMFDLPGNSSSITAPALEGGEAKASLKGTAQLECAAERDAEPGAARIHGLTLEECRRAVTAVTEDGGTALCPLQPHRPTVPSWGQTHPHPSTHCAHRELCRR